jgi:putative transposase
MRKNRDFTPGTAYHVTSRTNDKTRVFSRYLGQKIMLLTLQAAKDKYRFKLHNFCIMPTHIHLLITPADGTDLSRIMQWIKTNSAKYWNRVHGSTDHLWGSRFFARPAKDLWDYFFIHNYIDQNPVKAGLSSCPTDYKPSGAYQIAQNISGLVDYTPLDRQTYIKYLPLPKGD